MGAAREARVRGVNPTTGAAGKRSVMKKVYEKPTIIHTEKIEARAVSCTKASSNVCDVGPITS